MAFGHVSGLVTLLPAGQLCASPTGLQATRYGDNFKLTLVLKIFCIFHGHPIFDIVDKELLKPLAN